MRHFGYAYTHADWTMRSSEVVRMTGKLVNPLRRSPYLMRSAIPRSNLCSTVRKSKRKSNDLISQLLSSERRKELSTKSVLVGVQEAERPSCSETGSIDDSSLQFRSKRCRGAARSRVTRSVTLDKMELGKFATLRDQLVGLVEAKRLDSVPGSEVAPASRYVEVVRRLAVGRGVVEGVVRVVLGERSRGLHELSLVTSYILCQ